jgi:hypothetical protein
MKFCFPVTLLCPLARQLLVPFIVAVHFTLLLY